MDRLRVLTLLACFIFCFTQVIAVTKTISCYDATDLLCDNGNCVQGKRCDGISDCEDYTDEINCPLTDKDKPQLKTQGCENFTDHVNCEDGYGCIKRNLICDGHINCEDASDETNCTFVPKIGRTEHCDGFTCKDGKCISTLWMCDGMYDCDDKSDEDIFTCNISTRIRVKPIDPKDCPDFLENVQTKYYKCKDSSFCINELLMCDGMKDCKDGSDEGPVCNEFHKMCDEYICHDNATCYPDFDGAKCVCPMIEDYKTVMQYSYREQQCKDFDECNQLYPVCSHACMNSVLGFHCSCDKGYLHYNKNTCFAPPPEGKIYFTTSDDIRYVTLKTKREVVLARGLKQVRGITTDGRYLYWTEAAQGHQIVVRAEENNIEKTKTILASLGLKEPADIAADWVGGNIYFTDTKKGVIHVCKNNGSICATLNVPAQKPVHIVLNPSHGKMYWTDWHHRTVIMSARMDGYHPEILAVAENEITALALDIPNNRLYFIDGTIKVMILANRRVYSLLDEKYQHPYALAVFENVIYWSDWFTYTIDFSFKQYKYKQNLFFSVDAPIYDMEVFHPILLNNRTNPCQINKCTHMCLLSSQLDSTCVCPDDMKIDANYEFCLNIDNYRTEYIVVGGGAYLTRISYENVGNFESDATRFDIGRVQAIAYDNFRDNIFIYDGQRKVISYVNMLHFKSGITNTFIHTGLENVIEMDYDPVSDCLYVLDTDRRLIEVFSVKTGKRALVYRFYEGEMPVSFCVMSDSGRMMVAVLKTRENDLQIDSIGLDGEDRKEVVTTNLLGPKIRLRYPAQLERVYFSDEGHHSISHMFPNGTNKTVQQDPLTTISDLAVTKTMLFWVNRRGNRIYWSDLDGNTQSIRRARLFTFPNTTQLHLVATTQFPDLYNTLMQHTCFQDEEVCSNVCVQRSHSNEEGIDSKENKTSCLCALGQELEDGKCVNSTSCDENESNCYKSNTCIPLSKICNGKEDCEHGEDEENCPFHISDEEKPRENKTGTKKPARVLCTSNQFKCNNDNICISRAQVCDGINHCSDNSDEKTCRRWPCMRNEFRCGVGNCIPMAWRCDGDLDCVEGKDEAKCINPTCPQGYYQCRNSKCIELKRRCDGRLDCLDYSDEMNCEEVFMLPYFERPKCNNWEFACELNKSVCLPITARCNGRRECPGGTDEMNCKLCPDMYFMCASNVQCIEQHKICNGELDCSDGFDESPEICATVNKTSVLFPEEKLCHNGYKCNNSECIEWHQVCDNYNDCTDGSDEGGNCESSCVYNMCEQLCQSTPGKRHCYCRSGWRSHGVACIDIDECELDSCSQGCLNTNGSYSCYCHDGYALTPARDECKLVVRDKPAKFIYLFAGNVRVLEGGSADDMGAMFEQRWTGKTSGRTWREPPRNNFALYRTEGTVPPPVDIGFDNRRNALYLTNTQNLFEYLVLSENLIRVSNVGKPTKIAVEWVTGNTYFVDNTPEASYIRVCNFEKNKCAKLQKLPSNSEVTALVVDPSSRLMFYCVNRDRESVLWSATLDGQRVVDLVTLENCMGLAVNSYRQRLYVAESEPAHIIVMDYNGKKHLKILTDNPYLTIPHSLTIFEDSIYLLVNETFKLIRCKLYGEKTCEPFMCRAFNAETFVIQHDSVQRGDIKNVCEGNTCSNLCVLGERGPQCVCVNGSLFDQQHICPQASKEELAHFENMRPHSIYYFVAVIIIGIIVTLCVIARTNLVREAWFTCRDNIRMSSLYEYIQILRLRNATRTRRRSRRMEDIQMQEFSGNEDSSREEYSPRLEYSPRDSSSDEYNPNRENNPRHNNPRHNNPRENNPGENNSSREEEHEPEGHGNLGEASSRSAPGLSANLNRSDSYIGLYEEEPQEFVIKKRDRYRQSTSLSQPSNSSSKSLRLSVGISREENNEEVILHDPPREHNILPAQVSAEGTSGLSDPESVPVPREDEPGPSNAYFTGSEGHGEPLQTGQIPSQITSELQVNVPKEDTSTIYTEEPSASTSSQSEQHREPLSMEQTPSQSATVLSENVPEEDISIAEPTEQPSEPEPSTSKGYRKP